MFSIDRVEDFGTRTISFHCPNCGGRDSVGVAWSRRESRWALGFIPVFISTYHIIRGECCGRQVLSAWPPDQLAALSADEIQHRGLAQRNLSMVALALTAMGFVLCFIPGLCFASQCIALIMNRRETWWIRAINVVGILVGATASLLQLYWIHQNGQFGR